MDLKGFAVQSWYWYCRCFALNEFDRTNYTLSKVETNITGVPAGGELNIQPKLAHLSRGEEGEMGCFRFDVLT